MPQTNAENRHLAEQLPQVVDIAAVDRVIGTVATVNLMRQGHSAIGGDAEAKDELLQIGAVILVVTVSEPGFGKGAFILAEKSDRRRVVVDAACVQLKLLDGMKRQPKEQTARLWADQGIQAARHTIVIDGILFRRRQTERRRAVGRRPLGDAIERRWR